ncbi:hypothetical protein B0I35DRAFT_407407 [Stachybotrys elegans]|uniref:Uncharacterized protein n=1 Tax=Stachybotrys elegans TaxID=80388 RepID=A0A8K0SVZ0_9HYPO|nr:hypothetical protein B0I35DRAFT_407407 [Stachybotrys elegans]
MDFFSTFPAEIQLIILESFESWREVNAVAERYPPLANVLRQNEGVILSTYLKRELDDDLIQDAMAILTFPSSLKTGSVSKQRKAVFEHLTAWGAKELPNPTKRGMCNISQMKDLMSMSCILHKYIQDYLTKATSIHLPRAYHCLPVWSLAFGKCQRQTRSNRSWYRKNLFDLNILSPTKKRRILQAFLRYQLLCLIYRPLAFISWARETDQHTTTAQTGLREQDLFLTWDWRILSKFEKKDPLLAETQLLACVREYVTTLWEMLARVECRHLQPSYSLVDDHALSLLASSGLDPLARCLESDCATIRGIIEGALKFQEHSLRVTNVDMLTLASNPTVDPQASEWRGWSRLLYIRQRCGPLFNPTCDWLEVLRNHAAGYNTSDIIFHYGRILCTDSAAEEYSESFWKTKHHEESHSH